MGNSGQTPFHRLNEQAALRAIVEGTATETGEQSFRALVENLAGAMNSRRAWVAEYQENTERLRARAFWMDGQWIEGYEYGIAGTLCELAVKGKRLIHIMDNVTELFSLDPHLREFGPVSYIGVPLTLPPTPPERPGVSPHKQGE